jgi:serine/threonine-protein kinase
MLVLLAGISLKQRIAVDFFGETFAATGPGVQRVRVRRVDAALAGRPAFAAALVESSQRVAGLVGPNVIQTVAVGRDAQGAFLVAGADLAGPVPLEVCLRESFLSGSWPEPQVALRIVKQVAQALARAHRAGIVHGGVHPRSVYIDIDGEVYLGDFALARALATAAQVEPGLARSLGSYAPSELLRGISPSVDVYGAGALLCALGGADMPDETGGRVSCDGPPPLRAVVEKAMASDPARRFPHGAALLEALDEALRSLHTGPVLASAVAAYVSQAQGDADRTLDTSTEGMLVGLGSKSAALASDPGHTERTPLPPPVPFHEVASGLHPPDLPAVSAPQSPPSLGIPDTYRVSRSPRFGGLWGIIVLVCAVAVAVMAWQLSQARGRLSASRSERDEQAEDLARHRLVREGAAVVDSDPHEAAVWMRLGRTPLDSVPLDTAALHELRVEHEGYQTADIVVGPMHFSGPKDQSRAVARAVLKPAVVGQVSSPAPPAPDAIVAPAERGRGTIHVESEPAGAEVYLLVGFTGETRVTGLRTEREYEFKLVKDGHAPAFVVIRPTDWLDPSGLWRGEVRASVRLLPAKQIR